MKGTILFVSLILAVQFNLTAQEDTLSLKTIEGVTNKMIHLISGEIGEERDWEAYRNLFLPTAQKMSVSIGKDGTRRVRAMNLEEFVRNVGPVYSRDGFEEYAIGLTVNEFNGIATVFQSFYCKNLLGTYENRGVNSYQLVFLKDRWWIANTLFTNETEDMPLPEKFLFKKYQAGQKK